MNNEYITQDEIGLSIISEGIFKRVKYVTVCFECKSKIKAYSPQLISETDFINLTYICPSCRREHTLIADLDKWNKKIKIDKPIKNTDINNLFKLRRKFLTKKK